MKKLFYSLIALLLIPSLVNAATIETEFDEEGCVLTVSGTQTGHDATVSLFNNNGDLIGFKTGEINDSHYSVEFVLGYDADTTIDITLSNENGTNEFSKEDVAIKACEPPVVHHDEHPEEHGDEDIFHLGKILDYAENAVEDLNDKKPFHIDDKLFISVTSQSEFDELPEEDKAKVAALTEMLGEYKEAVAIMMIIILDDVDEPKHIPDSTYKILLKADKEEYQSFKKLKAIRLLDEETLEFSAPIDVLYDDNAQGMYFTVENIGYFVIYEDNSKEYTFLDKTDNQTFYKKSDKTLTLKIDAPRDKFVDVYVDGRRINEKYYEVKSGSTVITFTEEFLKGLDSGEHQFLVNFTDGSAQATVSVENTTNPNTGDKVVIYIGSALVAIAGLGAILILNKKLKNN